MFLFLFLLSLLFMTALALIPTSSKITFTVGGGTRLVLTVAFLKAELYNFSEGDGGASFALIRKILLRISSLLKHSSVTVEELRVPKSVIDNFSLKAFILPYSYHAVISAIIAYLKSNTEKLNIGDNAIALIPEAEATASLRISARVPFFYVIRAILQIVVDTKRSKPKKSGRAAKATKRRS